MRDAALRGPLLLRTLDRAVTAEDYEQLARAAAPDVARVRCIPAAERADAVRVLVVPAVPAGGAELEFGALRLHQDMQTRIEQYLEERRCVGAAVSVEPPFYQGVTVVAQLRNAAQTSADAVQAGEVYAVLQAVSGVDLVQDVRLFGADPTARERGKPVQRIDLPANALVHSFGHQVRVQRG